MMYLYKFYTGTSGLFNIEKKIDKYFYIEFLILHEISFPASHRSIYANRNGQVFNMSCKVKAHSNLIFCVNVPILVLEGSTPPLPSREYDHELSVYCESLVTGRNYVM